MDGKAMGVSARLPRLVVSAGNVYRRALAAVLGVLGPEVAYAITERMSLWLYRLLDPLRLTVEAQARAALGDRLSADQIDRIARRSVVHRVWNLVDLMLADRLLHPGTYRRYGGQLAEPHRSELLDAHRRGQAAILVTCYYGPYDLLPVFLGYNGVRATAVYRPHENRSYDAYRRRIRARSGCRLVEVPDALARAEQVLGSGGMFALVADHQAPRHGVETTFLGLPTVARRTVGILAVRHGADVVVAGIRRTGRPFRFEIVVGETIEKEEWSGQSDPVEYITRRYLRGLERIVLEDPSQYPWGIPRWGQDRLARLLGDIAPANA